MMRFLLLAAYLVFNLIQGHEAWIGKINNSTNVGWNNRTNPQNSAPGWNENRNQSVGWLPPTSGAQRPHYQGQPQALYPPPPQYPYLNTSSPTLQPYTTTQRPYYPPSPPLQPLYTTTQRPYYPPSPPLQPLYTTTQRPYYPTTTPSRPGYIGISPAANSSGVVNDFTRLTYDIPGNPGNKPNNSNVLNQLHRFKRFIPKTKLEMKNSEKKYQKCLTPDGRNGYCKHVKDCNLNEFKDDLLKVLDHMCIIERFSIGVCCPDVEPESKSNIADDLSNEIDASLVDLLGRIASDDPSERGCGLASKHVGKISNGKPSRPGQWPWMASLISNMPNKAFCGGVLITDRHILTAAHCVNNLKPREFRVRLGEYDFSKVGETQAQDFAVLESRLHIDFDPITYENDIAIVKLQRPTLFNSYVWPICMPPIDTDWQNHTGVVIGWGTQFFGGPYAKKLMEVEVPIWRNADCQDVYDQRILDTVMCAGDAKGGPDSCQGDSGGPLMIKLPNNRWVIAGIVSWGVKCGEPNHPGVYTRVNNYIKWVIENSVF